MLDLLFVYMHGSMTLFPKNLLNTFSGVPLDELALWYLQMPQQQQQKKNNHKTKQAQQLSFSFQKS